MQAERGMNSALRWQCPDAPVCLTIKNKYMNTKLYVGNLSADVTEASLQSLFSQHGPVTEVKLMMDGATGRSRGFAFVTMATPEAAQSALQTLHSHSVGGRYITVNEARPPGERPPGSLIGDGDSRRSNSKLR
jgi:RNA recognition motif-containing protein